MLFTYTKTFELTNSVDFTEDEIKKLIKDYKKDCEKWHLNPNDESNLKDFLDSEYLWDWNEYNVKYSESNFYDLYNEIEEYL